MARGSDTPPQHGARRLIGELFVSRGADAGLMIAVADNMVLGRDDDADVVLQDPTGKLSRRHMRIKLGESGPEVEDLDSTNGTFLNGERISDPRPLVAGDQIQIGESTLEFVPTPDLDQPPDVQVTRARDIPTDVTRARDIPSDVTRARDIPTDVTRARDVVGGAQETRARPLRPEPSPTYAPPGTDGELRIISGPDAGSTTPVRGGSATIGREPECDLQVLDSEVSRRHAKVTIRDGKATLDDLNSANGTYLNGERLLGKQELKAGDRIQIGEATIGLTSPVSEGTAVRPHPREVTAAREVITHAPQLLTGESGTRKWWTLAVVAMTTFMLLLDMTIIAVALPKISVDLRPGFTSLQWIVDAYTLMLATLLLTAGSMADIFGRKRLLTIGLLIFTVASVACAQAPSATFLVMARGVQGIGGSIMFACSLALIVQEFPADQRAVAFGVYGAVNGLAIAVGPILGGILVQGIGWQSIFYANLPIAAIGFILLRLKVVNLPGPSTKIDYGGLLTFSSAMFLAIFATIRGNDAGWTSALTLGMYGAAVVLFGVFIAIERRRKFPMLDLGLFRNPTFVGNSVAAFSVSFALIGLIFFLTTWMQSILGYSPVQAGLRMMVLTLAALATGPIAGKMTGTVSPRITLTVGLALVAVGVISMIGVDTNSSWTVILPGLVLAGLGMGIMNPTLASTAAGVVPPWRGGMASGTNSTSREAGATAGIAVLGTLVQHQVRLHANSVLGGTFLGGSAKGIGDAISVGGTPGVVASLQPNLRPGIQHLAHLAYADGLREAFVCSFGVATIGCLTAFVLVRKAHLRPDFGGGGH
jgi:EmrB/QacA subfamily drug resistance transporter